MDKLDEMIWISVNDRLPESSNNIVLAICLDDINDYSYPYTSDEAQSIAFYSNLHWWDETMPEECKEDNIIEDVTHWMPLPEPPEGE